MGPAEEGVRTEEGVDKGFYSPLFPDRITEAETVSNSPKVTKLRSVQESNSGLIKSRNLFGNGLPLGCREWFSHPDCPGGRVAGPHPGVSGLVALGYGSRTRTSNRFPDGIGATGPRPHFEKGLHKASHLVLRPQVWFL